MKAKVSRDPTPSRGLWESVWEQSTVPRPVHTHMLSAIMRVLDLRGATTLEVGCGSAVDSAEMACCGARAFTIDYSLPALRHAKAHTSTRNAHVALAAGDVFHLPYPNETFNLVFSQGLLEHFANSTEAVREQVRVLRPGGYLCVDVPQTWAPSTLHTRWHIFRGTWFAGWETTFSLSELEALLGNNGLVIAASYGWMYFPPLLFGLRNLHTLNERYNISVWLNAEMKQRIESIWSWLEKQRWYYRWMACIGVIARKASA